MIPDVHTHPEAWGVRPVLFEWAGRSVDSYAFFVSLGLIVAIALYYVNTRTRAVGNNGLYIATAAAVGGTLGAKIPIWIVNLPAIIANPGAETLLSGRTIVGGLIGGALAVYVVKRRLGITERLGNYLVPSLCAGILLGRIGCLLAGCCYGEPTALAWGVDFGDGVARHPTQLYEAMMLLGFLGYSQLTLTRHRPGALFQAFMIGYFAWRFAIEFIRVNPISAVGLTYYQVVAAVVLLYYLVRSTAGALGREPV